MSQIGMWCALVSWWAVHIIWGGVASHWQQCTVLGWMVCYRRIVVAPDGATVAVIMSSGIGELLCKSSTPQNETEETFQKVESLRSWNSIMSWSEKSGLVFGGLLFFCLLLLMKITLTQLLFHYVGSVLLGKPSWSHFHDERLFKSVSLYFSRNFQNSEFIAKSQIFRDLSPYRPCQELSILISFLEL